MNKYFTGKSPLHFRSEAISNEKIELVVKGKEKEAKEQKKFMDDPINNAINLITKPFKTASTTTPSPK